MLIRLMRHLRGGGLSSSFFSLANGEYYYTTNALPGTASSDFTDVSPGSSVTIDGISLNSQYGSSSATEIAVKRGILYFKIGNIQVSGPTYSVFVAIVPFEIGKEYTYTLDTTTTGYGQYKMSITAGSPYVNSSNQWCVDCVVKADSGNYASVDVSKYPMCVTIVTKP